MKDQIYYGPLSPNSYVTGYHGVMVVSVEEYKRELCCVQIEQWKACRQRWVCSGST